MKCILLCAGYATRLFPLTENFPKALLKVGGKAIIDYTLEKVNKIDDIDEIYLVTNAKYTKHFEDWANEKNNIKPIICVGETLEQRENAKVDDDILVLATDNLFEFELTDFYNCYKEKKAPCVCVRKENYELLKRLGVAELDDNMRMVGFEEKPAEPKGKYAVYAEYIYPREIVPQIKTYLEEGNSCDAPGNLVAYLYKKMPLYAYEFSGECFDIGTHEALAEVNELYSK